MLGRFQNSSVPVLILSTNSVPVPIGSIDNLTFGSGFKSSVLTVLHFTPKIANFYIWSFDISFNFSVKLIICQRRSSRVFWRK